MLFLHKNKLLMFILRGVFYVNLHANQHSFKIYVPINWIA